MAIWYHVFSTSTFPIGIGYAVPVCRWVGLDSLTQLDVWADYPPLPSRCITQANRIGTCCTTSRVRLSRKVTLAHRQSYTARVAGRKSLCTTLATGNRHRDGSSRNGVTALVAVVVVVVSPGSTPTYLAQPLQALCVVHI